MAAPPKSDELAQPQSLITKSTVDSIALQHFGKFCCISSTFDFVRSRSRSKRVPKSHTAKSARMTKSLVSPNEFPRLIRSTNSGSASEDSFQFSFSMLKIRSERVSGIPCRLILTKISSTSASVFLSGFPGARSSSMTDKRRIFSSLVMTSSNRAKFVSTRRSSSSDRLSLFPSARRNFCLARTFILKSSSIFT